MSKILIFWVRERKFLFFIFRVTNKLKVLTIWVKIPWFGTAIEVACFLCKNNIVHILFHDILQIVHNVKFEKWSSFVHNMNMIFCGLDWFSIRTIKIPLFRTIRKITCKIASVEQGGLMKMRDFSLFRGRKNNQIIPNIQISGRCQISTEHTK